MQSGPDPQRGGEGQGSLAALFNVAWARQGGNLTADRLALPAGASVSGAFRTDATHALRLYVSDNDTAWRGPADVGTPLQDRMRYLLVYGNETDAQIQAYEDAMPAFDPRAVC
ncbi:MAG: hypothetical protein QOE90_2022 [Thermoplasmata archaeon]|nr:hypothetical protein [Thermoplasmata archaeon]